MRRSQEISERRIRLGERELPYTLRRSSRGSLALRVDHRGLLVAVPLGTTLGEVEAFLREHAEWVLNHVREWEAVRPPPFEPADGAVLPLLGEPCNLRLLRGRYTARWYEGPYGRELVLQLPAPHEPEAVRRALVRALQAYGLSYFAGRVAEYCGRLALTVPAVRLTAARGRWGSCSLRSGIRINWRLIHLSRSEVDYVVAHEVAHLLEMNHSPRFWSLVQRLMPEHAAARAALARAPARIPLLG